MTNRSLPALSLGCAGLAGLLSTGFLQAGQQDAALLIIGLLIGICGVWVGIRRTRARLGRIDLFHPLVFPMLYVTMSFLAPAWVMIVRGQPLLGFGAYDLSNNTALLMTIAVLGFALGLGWSFRSTTKMEQPLDSKSVLIAGRLLLLVPLVLETQGYVQGGVLIRSLGQTQYSIGDSLDALSRIAAPTAVLLILVAHRALGRYRTMSPMDWTLILVLIGLLGINGSRGAVVGMGLAILFAYTRDRPGKRVAVISAALGVAFVFSVAAYRATALGGTYQRTPVEAMLTDWSVATYTTGITASGTPAIREFAWGSTYVDAAVRQLPSPVATFLAGPSDESGIVAFRRLTGLDNPSQGYGYSLPAEGFLNFGTFGLFGACFLFGLVLAWAYSRGKWPSASVLALVYPLLVLPLPTSLRSDAIGLIKGSLYPALIVGFVFLISRSAYHWKGRRGEGTFKGSEFCEVPAGELSEDHPGRRT